VRTFADVRQALRRLASAPGFCAVVVLTLGVGIGANLAIFAVVDRLLLRPLPYPDPGRIAMLWTTHAATGETRGQASHAEISDWTAQARSFEAIAPFDEADLIVSGAGEPERLPAAVVGHDFFRVLGVAPALGRAFTAEEDRPGNNDVVVLTDGLWRRRFGSDPAVVGSAVTVSARPHVVVGVLPASYEPPPAGVMEAPALYKPLGRAYEPERHSARHMRAMGRLAAGVRLPEAQAEMDRIAAGLRGAFPDQNAGVGIRVAPLAGEVAHGARRTLVLLLAAVGLVLLLACANVAHLVLARSLGRRREMAIRRALGASTGRLARLMMAEALVVSALGALAGLAVALGGTGALEALAAAVLPDLAPVDLDWRLAAFACLAALLTAVLVGLPPALQAGAADPAEALADGGRTVGGAGRRRFTRLLVAGEVAAAFVLLSAAGLAVTSLQRLHAVDPGFRTDGVAAMEMWLPGARYADDARHPRFFGALLERVVALPGVEAAGLVTNLPLSGNFDRVGVQVDGRGERPEDKVDMERSIVGGDYFRVLGIPLVRGRLFTAADTDTATAVAIVGRSTEERLWPGGALGKRIRVSGRWFQVVGVVGDVRHHGLDSPPGNQIYLSHDQWPSQGMVLLARGPAPQAIAPAVGAELAKLDPDLPLFNVARLSDVAARSTAGRQFAALLLSAFAGTAVFLALVGISGVVSHGVAQRLREIGVRIALGARGSQVAAAVVRETMAPVAIGLAAGIMGTLAAGQAMSGLLYGVARHDALTLGSAAAAVTAVAVLASWLPARRAARVDPLVVLRSE
jgi:predicted permease